MTVPARISLVTLGVADVARSTTFYESLGWQLSQASVRGEVSFFDTAGARLSIYQREAMAADAGVPAEPGGFSGITLSVNVESDAEVDAALAAAVDAGARLFRGGSSTEWGGYVGFIADPDGYLWEIASNPGFPLDDDGLILLP